MAYEKLYNSTLIDNSTLSGVERLLGVSEVKNLNNIDHDIVCLEKLICSILFFDAWFLVDDYKSYYSNRRKDVFSFIEPLKLSKNLYDAASKEAATFASHQFLDLENFEPVGAALKFFKQLKLSPQVRWDIFTSSEYLTLSYLVDEAESKQAVGSKIAAFGNEFTDASRMIEVNESSMKINDLTQAAQSRNYEPEELGEFVERISRKNPNFKGRGHQDTFETIMFGYGWIVERSKFYELIAQEKSLSCTLSPLRDSYALSAIGINPITYEEQFLRSAEAEVNQAIIKVSEKSDVTALTYYQPIFLSWLLSKVDNVVEAISCALELRDSPLFTEARAQFRDLSQLPPNEKKKEINDLISAIENNSNKLLKHYSVVNANGPSISVGMSLLGPSLSLLLKPAELKRQLVSGRKPIVRTYRSLARDLVAVERLGAIHEKITKNIRSDKGLYRSVSTTPKFMRTKSNDYGRPV